MQAPLFSKMTFQNPLFNKVIRVFKLFFVIFIVCLILFNAILVNIYSNIFNRSKEEHEEFVKVSSSRKWPAIRSRYNLENVTFDTNDYTTLLNLTDFKFVLNHADKCQTRELFMVIFVHSSAGNFAKRDAIRQTWGSAKSLQKNPPQIRIIFLVGQFPGLQSAIEEEDKRHGDMVMGNFVDTYRNMTYKHVMGLKWVAYHCRNARYVFKADDDIFVDLNQLIYYLKGSFGQSPQHLIACYLNVHSSVNRSYRNKWRVSHQEYQGKYYPHYCAGWGIFMSVDVVIELYRVSRSRAYFWVDDVFISGVLAQDLNLKHVDLGQRVSIDNEYVSNWLQSRELTLPPMFGFPNSATTDIYMLWNKTTQYYERKLKLSTDN